MTLHYVPGVPGTFATAQEAVENARRLSEPEPEDQTKPKRGKAPAEPPVDVTETNEPTEEVR